MSSWASMEIVRYACALRQALDFVEQDRLADPAEPREKHALLRPLLLHSAQKNACLLENRVSPDQLRRRGAGTRREGVLDRVHGLIYTRLYPSIQGFGYNLV